MRREQLLHRLSTQLVELPDIRPQRVALDGIDASGKTTLADELVPWIEALKRPVIRASIDGFHQPRRIRHQRGPDSPEGYFEDSFDYASLRKALLQPLGPQGNRLYRRAVFDFRDDAPLETPIEKAPENAVLLFDGVFLLRPGLIDQWDYRIFVDVKMELALQRALQRDLQLFGSAEEVRARYLKRYQPGQRLYYQLARPREKADVIVDNNDLSQPQLIFPTS
ncbi:uridine kinase [Ktedonosporobacter rubrisoli]|uniref:Uridine kinase n=1 Tax=Ktedonosporobacter rubrisoli TaxID=2509675 RepID=A0A4P6JNP0_KTERU|nr:uridine kinase [Ktedonosporobacter rubrisoli]QBD76937.1 uridine kinase [Ktedonosporobacter rubrisoli]